LGFENNDTNDFKAMPTFTWQVRHFEPTVELAKAFATGCANNRRKDHFKGRIDE
jgi:hypothetical protein